MHPLRAYRKARKIRLADVAQHTGLTVASISRIERGDQFPSEPALRRLRDFTNGLLSANDFFQWKNDAVMDRQVSP